MKKLFSAIAFLCIICTAPLAWPGPYFTQGINTGAMGTVAFGDGTVLLPSITFTSDLNTGWYWIGADNLGLSLGGVKVWDITKPTATFYQSKTSDGSAAGLYVYSHSTAATGNNDTLTSFRAQGEYSFIANTLRDYVGYNVGNFVVTAGTLENQYGIYIDNLTSATNNWAIYTAGGEVTNVFKAAQNLTLDARTTAHTDVDGVLDINLTSLTTNNKALDIDTLGTSTTGVIQYGLLNTLVHATALTATDHTMYGAYTGVTKSGADTSANTTTLFGDYTVASNTGSTDAGTKNTYAGYFTATGDTAGTATAYGIYATATGADLNYAGHFAGIVALGETTAPTTSPINVVQLWAADTGAIAGNSALHMRDELGNTGPVGFAVPRELTVAATANLGLNEALGGFITNTAQGGAAVVTLPLAAVNYAFTFIAGTTYAGAYTFTASNNNTITLDGVEGAANGSVRVTSVARGNGILFRSYPTTAGVYHWYAVTIAGPWLAL